MAEYLAKSEDLTAVADAIRAKGGTDAQLTFPDGFVGAVQAISAGTTITDGIVVKARNADGEATEVDIYGEIIYPFSLGANVSPIYKWFGRKVTKANLMSDVVEIKSGAFDQNELEEIHIPNTCSTFGANQFRYNNHLKNVKCDGAIHFTSQNGLYMFYGDKPTLQTVVLGSIGHSVTATQNDMFMGDYSNLTLTIYTDSPNADDVLSKFRNGAKQSTIIIKDSTTGETLVTSTP